MAMFENFPYTDLHNLNLDWIIKIAKDFLDQYTHIQQLIADGETSLTNLTESGLEQLQDKADNLETLLQAWYDTHSADIANQLASALADLNAWYNTHSADIDNQLASALSTLSSSLTTAINAFNESADRKAAQAIESIPADYSALAASVLSLSNSSNDIYSPIPITYGLAYKKSYSYVTETFNDKGYVDITDFSGSFGDVNNIIGLFVEFANAIHTFPNQVNMNQGYNINYGIFVKCDFEGTGYVGIAPHGTLSWNETAYPVMLQAVKFKKGGNFFPLTNLRNRKQNIPGNTSFTMVFIQTPTGSANIGCSIYKIKEGYNVLSDNTLNKRIEMTETTSYYKSYSYVTRECRYAPAIRMSDVVGTAGTDSLSGVEILLNEKHTVPKTLVPGEKYDSNITAVIISGSEFLAAIGINTYNYNFNSNRISKAVRIKKGYNIIPLNNLIAAVNITSGTELDGFYFSTQEDITPSTIWVEVFKESESYGMTIDYLYDIVFWGDSLTAGAGGNGTTFPTVCAQQLGKTYFNGGVGGEKSQTVALRAGANSVVIPNGAINGSYNSLTDSRGNTVEPLIQGGSDTVNPVIINGQRATLARDSVTGIYSISGYGGSSVPCESPMVCHGRTYTGDITVVWIGTNDTTTTAEYLIEYIDAMIENKQKYIVMGLTYGNNRDDRNAALKARYGKHYFDTLKMLVNYGLTLESITPTTQDNTDISNNVVPTSLRSDSVHLNEYGYDAVGKMLATFIKGLDY